MNDRRTTVPKYVSFRVRDGQTITLIGSSLHGWSMDLDGRQVRVRSVVEVGNRVEVITPRGALRFRTGPYENPAPTWQGQEVGWIPPDDDRPLSPRAAARLLAGQPTTWNDNRGWVAIDSGYVASVQDHWLQVRTPDGGPPVSFDPGETDAILRSLAGDGRSWLAAARRIATRIDDGELSGPLTISRLAADHGTRDAVVRRALNHLTGCGSVDGLYPWESPRVRATCMAPRRTRIQFIVVEQGDRAG